MLNDLPTLASTLDALQTSCGTAAAAARRIGMSRGALHLARMRRSLPDQAIVAAAAALNLPAGYLLACIHADVAASEPVKTAWHEVAAKLRPDTPVSPPLYYVKSEAVKKASSLHHVPLSPERENALRVLKWCLCVARIPPDSPRLAYYVSRWNVPFKVARARAEGSFEITTANCPPIDLCHLPAALAAIAESDRYNKTPPPIMATTRPTRLQA